MALLNHGTTLHITFNGEKTKVGTLRAISEMKMDSDMVDVTTLDAPGGWRMYQQGLKSAADLTLDGFMEKSDAGQNLLQALYHSGSAAVYEIAYPDGESCTFSALCKSVSAGGGEVDAVSRFSAVLKITGEVIFQ